MEHQRDIHDDSWKSRKPDRDIIVEKPRIKATLSLLEDLVADNDRIFDLGCGDGTIGLLLKEDYTLTVDGCDISEIAVDRAQSHYRIVHQLNIDDEDIPAKSGSYDIVICTDVLEHTLSPRHALNEIRRLLKDDGIAVISVPNYGFVRYRVNSVMGSVPNIIRDKRHYNAFTVSYLQELITDCGLDVQTTTGVSALQRLAKISIGLFAKTIIMTATVRPQDK